MVDNILHLGSTIITLYNQEPWFQLIYITTIEHVGRRHEYINETKIIIWNVALFIWSIEVSMTMDYIY